MKYIPGLDGIRALSALAVILFHLGVPFFGLGWAGVDCFFVLSGFLITGILIESKGSEHYFRNFYLKRCLRIFPIYYLVVIAVFVLFEYNPVFKKSIVYYLTYTQNFFFIKAGYGTVPQLSHTWSLAIEEQFYLLWPLVIWKMSVRNIARLSIWIIVIAFVFRTICSFMEWSVYTQNSLLFSRMDALACGSLLTCAFRMNIPRKTIFKTSRLVLISIISIGMFFAISHMIYSGEGINSAMAAFSSKAYLKQYPLWNIIYTVIALFFASAIGYVVSSRGNELAESFENVLESGVLKHLGKISYGLYLYHLPVFYLVDRVEGGPFMKIAGTYLISLLSWHLIEKRFNSLKKRL